MYALPTGKTHYTSWQLRAAAELERRRRQGQPSTGWPDQFVNARTGKTYTPHNEQEERFVGLDTPRYRLLKGGEGAGKSVAGIVKVLNRIRRGMSGICGSPDLEHFKKSLWPEFRDWCPWQCVIERQRYRQAAGWEPTQAFTMVFNNEVGGVSYLLCGGFQDPTGWEGPNISFLHFDESRRHKTADALKVFDGRCRIPGPNGEPPQLFFTTTPRKHWLYEYFGPVRENDPYADFKADSEVSTVLTEENIANLSAGFVEARRQSLTEAEARILLRAEWEDESDIEKFVNLLWWDACREPLPALTRSEPLVIALDAAKGGETNVADCFAMVAVSRHPDRKQDAAVRYCGIWQPQPGQLLSFEPIEQELVRLCREFSVIEVCYDPYQLHDMCTRLKARGVANFQEFSQAAARLIADKQLQDLIMSRRIAHDGNPLLRQHVDNADIKKGDKDGIRIVKRANSLKVDGAVALSMATARIMYYRVG